MDILTHTLSGIAIGTVIASFSKRKYKQKLSVIVFSAIGAALPDIDAISLWSGFDTTIGRIIGINHIGKEIYFSKFWYSHHAFMHSIFAGLLISMGFIFICYLFKQRLKQLSVNSFLKHFRGVRLLFIGFIFGFVIHLLEDMPTPASVWGGVNLFWPSRNYIGGAGIIWWWNNYDIFLIVACVVMLNVLVHITSSFIRISTQKITVFVLVIGFSLSVFQIKTRGFDFSYTGHTNKYQEFELKSREIQKQILGERLYSIMSDFDNRLHLNF